MFVAQILVANILLPCLVCAAAILAMRRGWKLRATDNDPDQDLPSRPAPVEAWLAAMAAALAMGVAFAFRNGPAFWSEDSWLRIPTAVTAIGLASAVSSRWHSAPKWAARLAVALIAAWIVFPLGESWKFLLPERASWIAAITLGTWVAWWSIAQFSRADAAILGLCWIACVAAAAFLTSQSFMKVTEPLLAVASILGCFSIASLVFRNCRALDSIAGPCLFALAAIVSNAQFNSFLGLTNRLSWFALGSPAIAALACMILMANPRLKASGLWRSLAFTTICCALAATIVLWTHYASGGSQEGDW